LLSPSSSGTSVTIFLESDILSLSFSACAIAAASWGRIYTFLMASEATPVSSDVHPVNTDPIRISNGSFEWAKKDDAPAPADDENPEKTKAFIHDVNMSIKKGSLTAIVGPVGCGKSSLFAAILGEMNCVSGKVKYTRPINSDNR
jgi:ATP-binding cassette subfamily C (CFTR/MRP) protein 1